MHMVCSSDLTPLGEPGLGGACGAEGPAPAPAADVRVAGPRCFFAGGCLAGGCFFAGGCCRLAGLPRGLGAGTTSCCPSSEVSSSVPSCQKTYISPEFQREQAAQQSNDCNLVAGLDATQHDTG